MSTKTQYTAVIWPITGGSFEGRISADPIDYPDGVNSDSVIAQGTGPNRNAARGRALKALHEYLEINAPNSSDTIEINWAQR